MGKVSREGGVVFCRLNSGSSGVCMCECESMHSPPWFDPVTMMGCGSVRTALFLCVSTTLGSVRR